MDQLERQIQRFSRQQYPPGLCLEQCWNCLTSSVTFFSTTLFSPAKGNYTGLSYDKTNGVSLPSSGYFTMSATAQGTFSGSLELSGRRYPFHGAFGTNGTVTLAVPAAQEEPLTMALTLDLTQGTGQMTGLMGDSAWTAQLLGNRAVFNSTTNPAPFQRQVYAGHPGGRRFDKQYGGDGYGTLSVSESGKISFSGSLANGTRYAASPPPSPKRPMALFQEPLQRTRLDPWLACLYQRSLSRPGRFGHLDQAGTTKGQSLPGRIHQ